MLPIRSYKMVYARDDGHPGRQSVRELVQLISLSRALPQLTLPISFPGTQQVGGSRTKPNKPLAWTLSQDLRTHIRMILCNAIYNPSNRQAAVLLAFWNSIKLRKNWGVGSPPSLAIGKCLRHPFPIPTFQSTTENFHNKLITATESTLCRHLLQYWWLMYNGHPSLMRYCGKGTCPQVQLSKWCGRRWIGKISVACT